MKLPVFRQARKSKSYTNALNIARTLHNKFYGDIMPHQMYCPYCGFRIDATTRKERLETLDEHVMDPNGTPSYKTVYKCSCEASKYTMWNYAGESYYDFPESFDHLSEEDKAKFWEIREAVQHFGEYDYDLEAWSKDAINSISFTSHNDVYNPGKKKHFEFKLWKNQKYIPRIAWNFAYDNFGKVISCKPILEYLVRQDPKPHPNGKSRKKTENPPYFIEQSICSQFKRRLEETKKAWKKYKENPSENNLKRLYGYTYGDPHWRKGIWKFWYTKVIPFYFGNIKGITYDLSNDK